MNFAEGDIKECECSVCCVTVGGTQHVSPVDLSGSLRKTFRPRMQIFFVLFVF